MRTLICFIFFCCTFDDSVFAKKHESRSNEGKRTCRIPGKNSKRVVKQYGSDYYRKIKPLIIKRIVIGVRDSISAGWMRREHKGRAYYLVEFPCDLNYEYFHVEFAARVYFWADTGIAFQVVFGNGWGFVEIDQPEKYKDQERVMKYERQPPKK